MIIFCRYDTCKSMLSKRATASDKAWRGLAGRAELSAAVCAIYVLSFLSASAAAPFKVDCALTVQVHGVYYILDSKVLRNAPYVPP